MQGILNFSHCCDHDVPAKFVYFALLVEQDHSSRPIGIRDVIRSPIAPDTVRFRRSGLVPSPKLLISTWHVIVRIQSSTQDAT